MYKTRVHRMHHRGLPRAGKFAAALAVSALLCAFGAGVGVAGNSGSAASCSLPTSGAQTFLPWNDHGYYFLAPGGSFEDRQSLQGWSLTGRTHFVKENETSFVGSASDGQSLVLYSGSSVTTSALCVTIHTPSFRFFLRNLGQTGSLDVSINYTDANGAAQSAQLGSLPAGSSWSLSDEMKFTNFLAPLVGNQDQTSVSFTFRPNGGDFQIDDLYVDPLKSQLNGQGGDDGGWQGGGW
jgi:hypothetical protein